MPQIQQVNVNVVTNDDNKEDSRFELDIFAGNTTIYHLQAGEGENWDNGDEHNFQEQLSADVVDNTPIRVIAALQDGNWGQSNHWDCHITVVLDADDAQFIAVCSRSKWSKHLTNSPLLALLAMTGSNAACKISSACSKAFR